MKLLFEKISSVLRCCWVILESYGKDVYKYWNAQRK